MCSHGLPWHMFLPAHVSPWHIFPWHMYSTGTCFPLAYVFPWHLFSRGTCVPTVFRGTCFPPAHVSPWHMFSHGTCFPVTLVDTNETHTRKKHCSTVYIIVHALRLFPWRMFSNGTCFSVGIWFPTAHVFPKHHGCVTTDSRGICCSLLR